jgi:WD40 repeat protein
VRVLDVASGRVLLDGNEKIVNAAAFSADGSRIAWGTMDSVRVWNVGAAREALTIHNTGGPVVLLTFSPDGTRLAGAAGPIDAPRDVKLWDAADGHELPSLTGRRGTVGDLAFSPDGARLVAYGRGATLGLGVTLWDAASGVPLLHQIRNDSDFRLCFQPDGRRLFLVNPYSQDPSGWDAYEVLDATPTAEEQPPKHGAG